MAKVLFQGAALLGFLALAHSDELVCNAVIERTDLKASGKVQLHCIVTGNATSLTWTRDGQPVPVTPSQPATLLVEIPSEYAAGSSTFECHVRCSKYLSQRASLKLESVDMEEIERTVTIAVGVSMAVVFIGLVVVYSICHYGRRCHCEFRDAQGSIDDLGTVGLGIALNAQPFIARPLPISRRV